MNFQLNLIFQLVVFVIAVLLMVKHSKKTFPVFLLMFVLFWLQHIVAPLLKYNGFGSEVIYYMRVTDNEYFHYTYQAIAFLFLGVLVNYKSLKEIKVSKKFNYNKDYLSFGFSLIAISYVFFIINLISPIGSIGPFVGNLKYIGGIAIILFGKPKHIVFAILPYIHLLLIVTINGVYIEFIVWCLFLMFFINLKYKVKSLISFLVIVFSFSVMIQLQGVKFAFRKTAWGEEMSSSQKLSLFNNLFSDSDEINIKKFYENESFISLMVRLNQGWHLSLVMNHLDFDENHDFGGEMIDDIKSSFLPRFLYPDKKVVSDRNKFIKYTGYKLGTGTAMTVGILGDFYLNYGPFWSIISLFVYGYVLARFFLFFMKKFVHFDVVHIIWIPYFFNYSLRAGNDFYIFSNTFIKGLMIFFIIKFILRKYFSKKFGADNAL